MRFLYPSLFLAWSALVLVPIVLYLFRPRPRTVRTSTLPFFKWLAREHQDSAWLRRLKYLLSLLLSLLVILGAAAALGRLVMAPPAGTLRSVVVLVDRSASMAARNAHGPTRLHEAVARLEDRLAGLPASTGVIVMAYDRRPEVLLARSVERRQVHRALASIEARPIEGRPAEALQLARRLAALEPPAVIWHATDGRMSSEEASDEYATGTDPERSHDAAAARRPPPPSDDEPGPPGTRAEVPVEEVLVPMREPRNVGITAFRLRRLPLQQARFEAFVQVHCVAEEPVAATLDVELDGNLVALRKLTLTPGEREALLIPLDEDPEAERVLSLKLSAEGDMLAWDDVVHARIPRLRPVRVLWISPSPDPFTELALSSLGSEGDLEVLHGEPSAWPPESPVDVAIFDGWLPEPWPDDVPAVAVNPPGPAGPVRAAAIEGGGLPLDTLRAPGEDHPVLYGVATGRVAVTQTAVLEAGGTLDSLWVGPQGPVLSAGEVRGQRIVVMAFSPQHSEQLPFMASYPLLIGNSVYWAAESRIESAEGRNRRTGDLVELEGRTLTWHDPGARQREVRVAPAARFAELDRLGLWTTDQGESGSAALLSVDDTRLPARGDAPLGASGATAVGSRFRGDLAPLLLWGLLGLFLVESWLFHRYFVY